MDENRTKKKANQNILDVVEWMLAIDFDLFEVRRVRHDLLHKDFPDSEIIAIGLSRGD
jgi:hypothetical protein